MDAWDKAANSPPKAYPVKDWHPDFCGDMNLVIRENGQWIHDGRPIMRPELVDLFAALLCRDGDDYYIVSPVEKLRITVEDCPLRIVDVENQSGLRFLTAQGQWLIGGEAHALVFDGDAETPKPRLHVRDGLWARFERTAYGRLFALGQLEITGALVLFRIGPYACEIELIKFA